MVGLQKSVFVHEASSRSKVIEDEHDRSYVHWIRFLDSVEISDDPFLDSVTEKFRPAICILLAQPVTDGEFSPKGETCLVSSTARKALDKVAKVFEAHRADHPFKKGSVACFEMGLLKKGHRSNDPPPESQEVTAMP